MVDDLVEAVTSELHDIANRGGLARVFMDIDRKGPVQLEHIGPLLERCYGQEWTDNRLMTLEKALRRAAAYLLNSTWGAISEEEAALRLFNLSTELPSGMVDALDLDNIRGNRRYAHIFQNLWNIAGFVSDRTVVSSKIKQLRRSLAVILTDPRFPNIPHPNPADSVKGRGSNELALRAAASRPTTHLWRNMMPYWDKPYARRNELHDQIKRSAAENCRIALYGLPGFGKTHLASVVAVEMADKMNGEALYLLGDSLDSLIKSVRYQLNIRNKTVAFEDDRVMRDFADLVSASPKPLVVVIDDVKDPTLPERVLPPFLRAPVIVTMRKRVVDKTVWRCIPIRQLSVDESIILGRAELSDLFSDDEIERLVTVLTGYALAIEAASALFRKRRYFSLNEFCSGLEHDITGVLDLEERHNVTLTFIYNSLLEHLESEHFHAAQLLAALVALRRNMVSRPALQGVFEGIPIVTDSPKTHKYNTIGFTSAIQKLEDYSFASSYDDDVSIHQLVRELVAKLILGRHPDVSLAAAIWLHEHLREQDADAREIQDWAVSISAVVDDLKFQRVGPRHDGVLTDLVVTAACSLAKQDDVPKLNALRNTWIFKRLVAGSGKVDRRIAYLLHKLLKFTDAEDDRLILVNLSASQYLSSSMTGDRKATVEEDSLGNGVGDRAALTFSIKSSNSSQGIESFPDPVIMGYDAMRKGDTLAAHAHASRPLQVGNPREKQRAHALLTRIAIRRLNLPAAAQHLEDLKAFYPLYGMGIGSPLVSFLAGDLTYAQLATTNQPIPADPATVEKAVQLFEKAKEGYREGYLFREVIPVGQNEVERRLACLAARSRPDGAMFMLSILLGQTRSPIMLPIHFRTAISLLKVAIIDDAVRSEYVDDCWRAAEFFSISPAFDRYWYAEALLTILLASVRAKSKHGRSREAFPGLASALGMGNIPTYSEPSLDMELSTPLGMAVIRELNAIGRPDKLEILRLAKRGALDIQRLLID